MIAASGFGLAAIHTHVYRPWLLLAVLVGMGLVIASACVFNNYIDKGIDQKMERTKRRALVTREISNLSALTYGSALGAAGFGLLRIFTNQRVVWLVLVAYISYVAVYGAAKRKTVHGTLVGTIPGAIPPVAGFAAISPLDRGALAYFLILVTWQMAHFYAIALYRQTDYASAGLPVMPLRRGNKTTKFQIQLYILLFGLACASLSLAGYTGISFAAGMVLLSANWFGQGAYFYSKLKPAAWGRKLFLVSLLVLVAVSVFVPLGELLP